MSAPTASGAQHERVRLLGIAILVAGLLAALLVLLLSTDDEAADPGGIARSKLYQHNLAAIGGHAAVNAARFNDWLASLWHGRSLALIIALVTLAVAGACFWVAHMMTIPPLPAKLGTERDGATDDVSAKRREAAER